MSPRRPFRDWSIESTIGLLFIVGTIIIATAIAAILGMLVYTMTTPAPSEPKQTVSQYVDKQGDVKRLCLVYKTGDHVDAVSCDLVDDITGQPKGTN